MIVFNKKYMVSFGVWLLVMMSSSSYAELQLELTQGAKTTIPIAVMPFVGKQSSVDNRIESIIANDLTYSGQFHAVDTIPSSQQVYLTKHINSQYWQSQGVNYLVLGWVKSISNHRYEIGMQLVDVLGKNAGGFVKKKVLLTKQFMIKNGDFRQAAHRCSDLIYHELTGDRGVFSTKLAYVLIKSSAKQMPTAYQLIISDFDGHQTTPVVISKQPIMSPVWSPDGKSVAYVSFEGHRSSIFIQNIQSGKRRLITQYPGINGAPAFSPDGKKLAMVLSISGYPKIYVLDIMSGKRIQLTAGWSIDTEPVWSRDGKSILFTSNRGGGPQIYRISLNHKKVERLTYRGNYNSSPVLTPDQKQLVYLHQENGFNIALQDLTNGDTRLLTQSGRDQSPVISPNGKLVLYATREGRVNILAMVSTNDLIKLKLPSPSGDVRSPAWSPFLNNS